ncbi:hypothetical protein SAY86_022254 [Trapa natans]|uniref:TITAN-like protein n=1 Tax=Trapa natans TaxID=22666 RepID=A0AAN7RFD2_TRANT|nr:hypothetical protein SAY86_022254 [Trapa natans]
MADNFREECSNSNTKSLVPAKELFLNKRKKGKEASSQFEYCKVCRLNHDQGQRHKYFPSHKKSLSIYLSRFESRLADVRFFLNNPIALRPENDSHNRFWCIFCDVDVLEIGSSFACNNAINHLSSADHLKNLKHFLWKYGGVMDCLDSFRILDTDVRKWKKKCVSLKKEAALSEERSVGASSGISNDIHGNHKIGNFHHFETNNNCSISSSYLNDVTPLQHSTHEYQIFHPEISGDANAVYVPTTLSNSTESLYSANNLNESRMNQQPLSSGSISFFTRDYKQVHQSGGQGNEESNPHGNVHSGAAPPWLDSSEHSLMDYSLESVSAANGSVPNRSEKSQKLNPKRVGAAWAEKRKIEMELEKRGEISKSTCHPDWLPNFGSVWQSGSRKESRKEFEMEKQNLSKGGTQYDVSSEIKPYISKRMHQEAAKK